jgi:hypothetical protein
MSVASSSHLFETRRCNKPKTLNKLKITRIKAGELTAHLKFLNFLIPKSYYLQPAPAGKNLTSTSVDMSRRASKSAPLKLNFLKALFFGYPLATVTPVSTPT